jgi:hypothetical protein
MSCRHICELVAELARSRIESIIKSTRQMMPQLNTHESGVHRNVNLPSVPPAALSVGACLQRVARLLHDAHDVHAMMNTPIADCECEHVTPVHSDSTVGWRRRSRTTAHARRTYAHNDRLHFGAMSAQRYGGCRRHCN